MSIVPPEGARIRPVFDHTCSHLVHCGKAADLPKEAKQTRAQALYIVSPQWLRECSASGVRVSESMYPFSYDERNALVTVANTSAGGTSSSYWD